MQLFSTSLGEGPGGLSEGAPADLCVFAADEAWTVSASTLASRSKLTPYAGYELPGRVRCTLVAGAVAYDAIR